MPLSVLSSPFGSIDQAARANCPEAMAWLADLNGPKAPDWIWVVPSARRKRAIIRNWPGTETGRASLLPRIVTLDGLVDQVAATQGVAVRKIGSMERRLRVLKAWQSTLPDLASGAGTAAQMDQAIKVWQDNHVTPTEPILAGFFKQYRNNLAQSEFVDRQGWLEKISRHLHNKKFDANAFGAKGVVVDGFHLFSIPELSFLRELAQHIELRVWIPCPNDGNAGELLAFLCEQLGATYTIAGGELNPGLSQWAFGQMTGSRTIGVDVDAPNEGELIRIDCKNIQAEANEVVRRIRLRLNEPRAPKPHQIAVVLPGPEYDPLVRQAFTEAGITINLAGRSRTLLSSGPGRLILTAIQRIEGTPSARTLLDFLRQPILRRTIIRERVDELAWLEETLDGMDMGRDFSSWPAVLNTLREELAQSTLAGSNEDEAPTPEETERFEAAKVRRASLLNLVEEIHTPLQLLARNNDSLSQTVNHLSNYLNQLKLAGWLSPAMGMCHGVDKAVIQADQLAWAKIGKILTELPKIPPNLLPGNRAGQPDSLNLISMVLEAENYQIKTEDDEGVQVMEIRETRGLTFREIHVLGLKSGAYDSVTEEEILRDLLHEEKQAKARARQESCQIFFQLALSGAEALRLYRPRTQKDEDLLPSVWIESLPAEVAQPQANLGVGKCQIQILTGLATPLDGKQTLEELRPTSADNQAQNLVNQLARQREALNGWWRAVQTPEIVPCAQGLITLRARPETPLSPSRIEQYTKCPFQFFAERMLHLEAKGRDETALHRGSLIHLVFQRFLEEYRTNLGIAKGQPAELPADRNNSRTTILKIWENALASDPRARYFDRKIRAKVVNPRGVIDIYLDNLDRLREKGIKHVASEEPIGPANLGDEANPLFLRGRIDDHFVWPDESITLVDYKSGDTPGPKDFHFDFAQRLKVQLDLYAAVLEKSGQAVKQGMYLYLELNQKYDEKDKINTHTVLQGHFIPEWLPGKRNDCPKLDKDGAVTHAKEVANSIRNGVITLTTFQDKGTTPCKDTCSVRNICRTPVEG
jgi:hypothetical protein